MIATCGTLRVFADEDFYCDALAVVIPLRVFCYHEHSHFPNITVYAFVSKFQNND